MPCKLNNWIYRWNIMLKDEIGNLFNQRDLDNVYFIKNMKRLSWKLLVNKRHSWQLMHKLSIPRKQVRVGGTIWRGPNRSIKTLLLLTATRDSTIKTVCFPIMIPILNARLKDNNGQLNYQHLQRCVLLNFVI